MKQLQVLAWAGTAGGGNTANEFIIPRNGTLLRVVLNVRLYAVAQAQNAMSGLIQFAQCPSANINDAGVQQLAGVGLYLVTNATNGVHDSISQSFELGIPVYERQVYSAQVSSTAGSTATANVYVVIQLS